MDKNQQVVKEESKEESVEQRQKDKSFLVKKLHTLEFRRYEAVAEDLLYLHEEALTTERKKREEAEAVRDDSFSKYIKYCDRAEKAEARVKELEEENRRVSKEYSDTLNRIWAALGMKVYEDAKGKTIWENVADLKHSLSVAEEENKKLKIFETEWWDRARQHTDEMQQLQDENKRLEDEYDHLKTLTYSQDISEWKSAAFQKIKGLEVEIEKLKDQNVFFKGGYLKNAKEANDIEAKLERAKEALKHYSDFGPKEGNLAKAMLSDLEGGG